MANEYKVTPGQPFRPPPAEIWNGMVDAGESFRKSLLSQQSPSARQTHFGNILKAKNGTGANREAGEIAEVDGLAVTELSETEPWVTADTPDGDRLFGVWRRPTVDDEYGDLVISGPAIAKVNITDTEHLFAEVAASNHALQSAIFGSVRLCYPAASTGPQKMLVMLDYSSPTPPVRLAQTPSAGIAAKSGPTVSSATCDTYRRSGSTVSADGGSLTVYNYFTSAVAGSTDIICGFDGKDWYVISEDCP